MMKKLSILISGLLATLFVFAQPQPNLNVAPAKLKLETGQKITAESTTEIQGDFGMGMELGSNSVSVNTIEVLNMASDKYSISNTLTRMKVDFNMMGQNNSYDSENPGNGSDELSRAFDDKLNKPVEVTIDGKTGLAVKKKAKNNKNNEEDISNPAADLMNMFGDASDEAVVSSAFELVPQGKIVGDTWADTTKEKDFQSIRKYTLKAVDGNIATLDVSIVTNAVNKLDFQGMEFEIKTKGITKAEIVTDKSTGLVKQKKSVTDVTGSFQMMGQNMPINASVKTNSIYN